MQPPFCFLGHPYIGSDLRKPVDRGGSVGSDEPPRLPNGTLEVFRKLLYWLVLTLQIAVVRVEDCSKPVIWLAS